MIVEFARGGPLGAALKHCVPKVVMDGDYGCDLAEWAPIDVITLHHGLKQAFDILAATAQ